MESPKQNQIIKEKLLEVELQKKYENLSDQELELKRENLDYALNEMIQEIKDKRDVASLLETERGVVESIQRKRRWKEYKK
jgi:hypothetical protein